MRKRTAGYGWATLKSGEMPTPKRLKAACNRLDRVYHELMATKNPKETIQGKDPRTVQSYQEALEVLRVSKEQAQGMISFLETILQK